MNQNIVCSEAELPSRVAPPALNGSVLQENARRLVHRSHLDHPFDVRPHRKEALLRAPAAELPARIVSPAIYEARLGARACRSVARRDLRHLTDVFDGYRI